MDGQQTTTPSRDAKIAQEALIRQGEHGAITEIAHKHGVSRPTVYKRREQAISWLIERFDPVQQGVRDAIVAHLALEWADIERSVVALRCCGCNSVAAIQAILAALFGLKLGYGTVWRMLDRAHQRAHAWFERVSLNDVRSVALDEVFSRSTPVLCGVCLDSGFVVCAEPRQSRDADTWKSVLQACGQRGLRPRHVLSDAAKGIESGVRLAFGDEAVELREDLFHVVMTLRKHMRWFENRAYRAIKAEYDAVKEREEARQRARAGHQPRDVLRSLGQKVRQAREAAVRCIERADAIEKLVRVNLYAAMRLVDHETGKLRHTGQMRESLLAVVSGLQELGHQRATKAAGYLRRRIPGLLACHDQRDDDILALEDRFGVDVVRFAAQFLTARGRLDGSPDDVEAGARLWVSWQALREHIDDRCRLGDELDADEVLSAVAGVLRTRYHQASSAVESFNSRLRPHLHAHKCASARFVTLFAAYENLRPRRSGRHKGRSPYEVLTGRRVDDWLTELGYPPSKTHH